jgi:hypothetical protein
MSAIPFDKKLAELDAYLQMLISEREALDRKLNDFTRASNATINNFEKEVEGIVNIRNNLEKLLESIKHSIVLLQIAKVSSRASFSSTTGDLKSGQPTTTATTTPSPPSKSKFRSFKSSSFSEAKDTIRNKLTSRPDKNKKLNDSSSSSSSVAGNVRGCNDSSSPRDNEQARTGATAAVSRSSAGAFTEQPLSSQLNRLAAAHQTSQPPRPSQIRADTTVQKSSPTGTAETLRDCESDAAAAAYSGRKGYTVENINNDGVNSNGAHQRHNTPSSSLRVRDSNFVADNDDDDDDDDDAFFDADDIQHNNQSKITSIADAPNNKERLLASESSIQKGHPDSSLLGVSYNESSLMPTRGGGNNMAEANNNIDNNQLADNSIDWDALYDDEDEDELVSMEGEGSVIKHLLSQIRIGMDLTKVVLPTFILERRSLLEMYADFFAHPDLFSAIPDFQTPEERMIQLVRWYLSAFHAGRKSSLAKKPYNPILGEIFKCEWPLDGADSDVGNKRQQDTERGNNNNSSVANEANNNNNTNSNRQQSQQKLTFVAEQVSHHPPVSAFYAENKEKGISCCAHIYTKSKYLGLSVGVHNIGKGVINLSRHKETYVCTFPSAYGRSILTVPWVELGGPVSITCEQTGYKANIEFVMKPFYGGKKHRITGEILRPNNEPILTLDGEWNGIMYSKSPPNSSGKQIFVDTFNLPVIKKAVNKVTAQESFESRNVWKEVTRALKMKDVNSATAAKSYIEQRQRDLLKDRLDKGVKWKTRYFEPVDDGWQYAEKEQSDEVIETGEN